MSGQQEGGQQKKKGFKWPNFKAAPGSEAELEEASTAYQPWTALRSCLAHLAAALATAAAAAAADAASRQLPAGIHSLAAAACRSQQ